MINYENITKESKIQKKKKKKIKKKFKMDINS